MSRLRSALILALSVCFCCGCQREAVDTRAQDERAIREADAATLKAAQAKDADGAVANYAEDGSWLPPNAPMVNGKAAIKAAMAPFFSDPNFALAFQSTRAVASKGGDMVYSQGTYSMTMTDPKTKKPVTDKGKYLTIYAKQADGSWKAIADTFNSDSQM